MEPSSIIFLEQMNEDKSYVFKQVGMKYDFIMSVQQNKIHGSTKEHFADNEETQEK